MSTTVLTPAPVDPAMTSRLRRVGRSIKHFNDETAAVRARGTGRPRG